MTPEELDAIEANAEPASGIYKIAAELREARTQLDAVSAECEVHGDECDESKDS